MGFTVESGIVKNGTALEAADRSGLQALWGEYVGDHAAVRTASYRSWPGVESRLSV